MEFKNLAMNTKSAQVKSNSTQYQFSKKNPQKPSFVVIFTQRVFFLNSSTAVVPQHLDAKDTEYRRIWFHHYQFPKIIQSIWSIHQIICEIYTWFRSPMIYKALPIFDHAHPMIIKVTFTFPKFVSACKNQPNSSIHSWDTIDFRVPRPKRPSPFLTTTIQKLLK